jgi:CHU_C Type IX secretion signal domain
MKNLLYALFVAGIFANLSSCNAQDDPKVTIVKEYESCCGLEPVTYKSGVMQAYFPNVFTPNGDGINDLFYPIFNDKVAQAVGFTISDTSNITYFDRPVFIPSDLKNYAWDGKDKQGKPYKGVFRYQISITSADGQTYYIDGKACSIVCGPDAAVFKTKDGCYYSTQATPTGTVDKSLPNKESDCFK